MPDTYTSQFSGEEIDSALRAAQIISGASTLAELREKLEIRGDNIPVSAEDSTLISEALTKIPTTSGGGVNPNLLDNWYFGRPVNQRGQTEYTPTWNGYSIDRWNVESDSKVVITLVNGGIRVKNTASSACQFKQTLPSELNLVGKMVTISLLASDVIGTVNCVFTQVSEPYQNSAACSVSTNGLFSASGSVLTGQQKFVCNLEPGAEITLLAAKLELGDTQTLAHKENEKWVLNEIPDFGEQLARCQRYARAYKCLLGQTFLPLGAYRSDRKAVSFALPTSSFRAVPTVSALNDIFQLFDGANVYGITSLAVTDYSDGLVTIYAYTSQPFENGKVLWLFSNNGTLLLSADL